LKFTPTAFGPVRAHRIAPCMAGKASLFRIRNTDDLAGSTGH